MKTFLLITTLLLSFNSFSFSKVGEKSIHHQYGDKVTRLMASNFANTLINDFHKNMLDYNTMAKSYNTNKNKVKPNVSDFVVNYIKKNRLKKLPVFSKFKNGYQYTNTKYRIFISAWLIDQGQFLLNGNIINFSNEMTKEFLKTSFLKKSKNHISSFFLPTANANEEDIHFQRDREAAAFLSILTLYDQFYIKKCENKDSNLTPKQRRRICFDKNRFKNPYKLKSTDQYHATIFHFSNLHRMISRNLSRCKDQKDLTLGYARKMLDPENIELYRKNEDKDSPRKMITQLEYLAGSYEKTGFYKTLVKFERIFNQMFDDEKFSDRSKKDQTLHIEKDKIMSKYLSIFSMKKLKDQHLTCYDTTKYMNDYYSNNPLFKKLCDKLKEFHACLDAVYDMEALVYKRFDELRKSDKGMIFPRRPALLDPKATIEK